MTNPQKAWDIVVRSLKTALAAYLAFVAAGGFNIVHVSQVIEAKIAALAATLTALLNIGLRVHEVITSSEPEPLTPVGSPTAPTGLEAPTLATSISVTDATQNPENDNTNQN